MMMQPRPKASGQSFMPFTSTSYGLVASFLKWILNHKNEKICAFRANPFTVGKKFFTSRNSAQPEFTLEEAHQHFSNTYADPDHTSDHNDFPDAPDVIVTFGTFSEASTVI